MILSSHEIVIIHIPLEGDSGLGTKLEKQSITITATSNAEQFEME